MLCWFIAVAGTVEPWCSANLRSCSSDALCWWAAFLARLLALRRLWCQVGTLPSASHVVLSALRAMAEVRARASLGFQLWGRGGVAPEPPSAETWMYIHVLAL